MNLTYLDATREPLPAYLADQLDGDVMLRVTDPAGIPMADPTTGIRWHVEHGEVFAIVAEVGHRMVAAGVARRVRIEGRP